MPTPEIKPFDAGLRSCLETYQERHGLTIQKLARALDTNASQLSCYLNEKPKGDVATIEKAIRNLLRHEARQAEVSHGLFETRAGAMIAACLAELSGTLKVGLIYGDSGTGKSCAVNLFIRDHPATIVITAKRYARTAADMARMLCEAVGDAGRSGRRAAWLEEQLTDSRRLIVVDNADELTYDAVKFLFDFADATRCPVCLIGNLDVLEVIRRNQKIFSRLGLFESVDFSRWRPQERRSAVRRLLNALCPEEADAVLADALAVADRAGQGHLRAVEMRVLKMQETLRLSRASTDPGDEYLRDPLEAFKAADDRLPKPGCR